jgi:hypothetical protein
VICSSAAHPSGAFAEAPASFRPALTLGDDVVDVSTWAGSVVFYSLGEGGTSTASRAYTIVNKGGSS